MPVKPRATLKKPASAARFRSRAGELSDIFMAPVLAWVSIEGGLPQTLLMRLAITLSCASIRMASTSEPCFAVPGADGFGAENDTPPRQAPPDYTAFSLLFLIMGILEFPRHRKFQIEMS